jgi:hypothetical protein
VGRHPHPGSLECIGGGKKYNERLRFRRADLRNTARGGFGEIDQPPPSPGPPTVRGHR